MCADDRAARDCGTTPLATALHRFLELGTNVAPRGALAAADRAVALRIERLHGPHSPINAPYRWALALVALTVATTPASLFVLPA